MHQKTSTQGGAHPGATKNAVVSANELGNKHPEQQRLRELAMKITPCSYRGMKQRLAPLQPAMGEGAETRGKRQLHQAVAAAAVMTSGDNNFYFF
ncbi:hypothetical protein U1Q18_024291 [Sarracenia purpurea var. burkii]